MESTTKKPLIHDWTEEDDQALLDILELRKDFQAARGTKFTLRAFHDALLRYGGLPVALIRWGLGLNA